MAKFRLCLTRNSSEDTSVVVEAKNARQAERLVSSPDIWDTLEWQPGDWAASDFEIYDFEQVDDDTPAGPEPALYMDKTTTVELARLRAALVTIANINNGPDQASVSWRCQEAAAIAAAGLREQSAAIELHAAAPADTLPASLIEDIKDGEGEAPQAPQGPAATGG